MAVLSFYVTKCYNTAWYISGGRFMDNWPLRTEVQLQSWRCAVLYILWMQWQLDLWSWQQWRPLLQTWEWVREVLQWEILRMREQRHQFTSFRPSEQPKIHIYYIWKTKVWQHLTFSLSEDYFKFFGFNDWTCGHLKKCKCLSLETG